jgi:hypothetical protein
MWMMLPPPAAYAGDGMLAHMEGAADVDRERALPVGIIELGDRRLRRKDRGVVDEDVQGAEPPGRRDDRGAGRSAPADVARQTRRGPARSRNGGGSSGRSLAVDVGAEHRGALASELRTDGVADAAGSAGDDRDLSLQSTAGHVRCIHDRRRAFQRWALPPPRFTL